jgi:hypothetical protein
MDNSPVKMTTSEVEDTALRSFDDIMDLFARMSQKAGVPEAMNAGFGNSDLATVPPENSLGVLFSIILQESLIEIGLADGDFNLNEQFFVEKIGKRYPLSLLSLYTDSSNNPKLTWEQFFALNPHEMANILDEIKTAGTPLALSFYNLFAKIDSIESGAPDFKELGGYLMSLINAYLSIDLSRSQLENQRALDVISDNILVPLQAAYQNAEISEEEADHVDGKA